MPLGTAAGTTLGLVASQPATFDQAGYEALTYANIGNIENMGEYGRVYELVTFNPIDTRGTKKFKGSFDEGALSMTIARDSDDAGMIALEAAVLSDADLSFEVVYPDGDKDYFQAKVMSTKKAVGSVNDIRMVQVDVQITTNDAGVGIVTVLA